MEDFIPFLGVIGMLFSLVVLVKVISDNKLRGKLIEKEMVNENIKYLFMTWPYSYQAPGSLKWGILLLSVGFAFLVATLLPADVMPEVTIGLLFVFAGLGLVVFHALARNMAKNRSDQSME